jgi:hypothetical protein
MARCNRCGKGGLFFRVNSGGRCPDCERILMLQAEYTQLEEGIKKMRAGLSATESAYNETKEKGETPYEKRTDKARKDVIPETSTETSIEKDIVPETSTAPDSAGLQDTTEESTRTLRLVLAALGAEFQNALLNMRYSGLDEAIRDMRTAAARLQEIATQGNQDIAPLVTKILGDIEQIFVRAIENAYEYYLREGPDGPRRPERQGSEGPSGENIPRKNVKSSPAGKAREK